METPRLVTELFFEKPTFAEVSKISKIFDAAGIKNIIMPPEDRAINTHLIIEPDELQKAEEKLDELGIKARTKEVILIELENKPGRMADISKKISENGINMTYSFAVAMNPQTTSYVLIGTEDNKAALEALKK